MDLKKLSILALALLLVCPAGPTGAQAQPSSSAGASTETRERYSLMMRKGKEAFARGRYNEAKDFFRKAIQADPAEQAAWSYYDLAQMYAVAEQYKNHGRVIHSTAPEPPPETVQSPQPAPPGPPAPRSAPAVKPAREKGKASATQKGKPAPPSESKSETPGEIKPAQPASPAPVPIKPAQPPGGMKILKDEGC
jgi:hypothetical protein